MTEAALEAFFHSRVRSLGGFAIKLAPIHAGIPDRLVLMPGGHSYLVELKTVTGRLSAIQQLWHERAAELGHRTYVLHGKEEIQTWLRARVAEHAGESEPNE